MKKALVLMVLVMVLFPGLALADDTSSTVTGSGTVRSAALEQKLSRLTPQQRLEYEDMLKKKEAMKAEYLQNLKKVKSDKTKLVIEKMTSRVCQVNQNRTEVMTNQLTRMLAILDKVSAKADEQKALGKDVTSVVSAVAAARVKVESAKAAVSVQSVASCVVNISGSDATFSAEVRSAVKDLEVTLRSINSQVAGARSAVSDAIKALAAVMGVEVNPSVTPKVNGGV